MTGTMERGCMYDPSVIVVVVEIIIENDDDDG